MKRATLLLTTLLASISMSAVSFAGQGKDMKFGDVDKDGDGNVSQQELQQAGKRDVQMQQLDQDNDGVLGEDEFNQAKDQWKNKKQQ